MFGFVLSILFISSFTNFNVRANTSDDSQKFLQYLRGCWKEYTLTPKDLEDLKNLKMPDSEQVKCYFACAFKKAEMMNDKGEFWVEGVQKISLEYYGSNETLLKKVNDFIDVCKKVNDIPVSDGERGCERAALMFQCTNEHAPEFGFA